MGDVESIPLSRLLRVSRSAIVGAWSCCVPDVGDCVSTDSGGIDDGGFSPVYYTHLWLSWCRLCRVRAMHTIEYINELINTTPTASLVFGATTRDFCGAPGGIGGRVPSDMHLRWALCDGGLRRCR